VDEIFGNIHHIGVIGICLIKLKHGKLGIMLSGYAFISVHTAKLIDFLQPAYDQTLQMKFQSNPHIKIHIKGIMVRNERPCTCSSGNGMQRRSLDFNVTSRIKEFPHCLEHSCALQKHPAHVRINYKVEIAVPIAKVNINQAMPLLRQGTKGFAKKSEFVYLNAYFSSSGAEHLTYYTYDVPDIQGCKKLVGSLTQGINFGINLDTPGKIQDIRESCLAVTAHCHQSACYPHDTSVKIGKIIYNFLTEMRPLKSGSERIHTVSPEGF
jgi:hypothetical protein